MRFYLPNGECILYPPPEMHKNAFFEMKDFLPTRVGKNEEGPAEAGPGASQEP